jgi:hypothetical protein
MLDTVNIEMFISHIKCYGIEVKPFVDNAG